MTKLKINIFKNMMKQLKTKNNYKIKKSSSSNNNRNNLKNKQINLNK